MLAFVRVSSSLYMVEVGVLVSATGAALEGGNAGLRSVYKALFERWRAIHNQGGRKRVKGE